MSSRAQIDRPFTYFAILLQFAGWLRQCVLNFPAKHYDAHVAHIYDYDAKSKRIYRYDWVDASTRVHVLKNEQVRPKPRLAVPSPYSQAQQSQLRRQPKLVHQSMQPISSYTDETPTLQSPDAVTKNGLMYFRARMYDTATGEFASQDPMEYVDGMSLYRGYFVPNGMDPLGQEVIQGGTFDIPDISGAGSFLGKLRYRYGMRIHAYEGKIKHSCCNGENVVDYSNKIGGEAYFQLWGSPGGFGNASYGGFVGWRGDIRVSGGVTGFYETDNCNCPGQWIGGPNGKSEAKLEFRWELKFGRVFWELLTSMALT